MVRSLLAAIVVLGVLTALAVRHRVVRAWVIFGLSLLLWLGGLTLSDPESRGYGATIPFAVAKTASGAYYVDRRGPGTVEASVEFEFRRSWSWWWGRVRVKTDLTIFPSSPPLTLGEEALITRAIADAIALGPNNRRFGPIVSLSDHGFERDMSREVARSIAGLNRVVTGPPWPAWIWYPVMAGFIAISALALRAAIHESRSAVNVRRVRARLAAHRCPACAYPMPLAADRCPECGTAFEDVIVKHRAGE